MQTQTTHLYILHGWTYDPRTAEKWEPLRALLADQGVQSTFLELPGLLHPLTDVWGMDEYVAWLEQTLPEEPVILVGHSFGGQLATHFAARFPDRVAKLVLIASSGVRNQSLQAQVKRVVFGSAARMARLLGLNSPTATDAANTQFLRKLLYKIARERDYLQATPIQRQTMARVLEAAVQPVVWLIKAPTLLIWGDQDQVTPLSTLAVYQHIAGHRLKMIAAARHSPQYTHTSQVARSIAQFVIGQKDADE